MMENIEPRHWMAWMGSVMVAVVAFMAYAFTTFATKEEVRDMRQMIYQRLYQIETKVDVILQRER